MDVATVNRFLAPAPALSGDLPVLPAVRLGRPGELKKRVTIPESPVTPASGRKCAAGACHCSDLARHGRSLPGIPDVRWTAVSVRTT